MELITKADHVKNIANCWKLTYAHAMAEDDRKLEIYRRLVAEGESLTEYKAAEIIGSRDWGRLSCDECGKNVDSVVQAGEAFDGDYDSVSFTLCKDCLIKALFMIEFEETE